jgi:hypothetical protein
MLPQGRNRKSEPDHRLMIEPRWPFRCTTANARSAYFRTSFFPWKVDKPLPLGRSRTHQVAPCYLGKSVRSYDFLHQDNDLTLKAASALKLGFVTAEFDRVVDPARMARPYVAQVS